MLSMDQASINLLFLWRLPYFHCDVASLFYHSVCNMQFKSASPKGQWFPFSYFYCQISVFTVIINIVLVAENETSYMSNTYRDMFIISKRIKVIS